MIDIRNYRERPTSSPLYVAAAALTKRLTDMYWRSQASVRHTGYFTLTKEDADLLWEYLQADERYWNEMSGWLRGVGIGGLVGSRCDMKVRGIPCLVDQPETKIVVWDDREQLRVLSAAYFCGAKDER